MKQLFRPQRLTAGPVLPTRTVAQIQISRRTASTKSSDNQPKEAEQNASKPTSPESVAEVKAQRKKTVAEEDEELRLKLEGISGDGGESGLELEGGKAVAMKRGVRENMFRLI